jgi:hypothetical protein
VGVSRPYNRYIRNMAKAIVQGAFEGVVFFTLS